VENVQVLVNNIRTHFLIAAIGNGIAALIGTIWVIVAGAATCGIGCLFFFLPLINVAVMATDLIAMSKVQQPPSPSLYSFLKMASIFDIFACFAIVPLVMGILNLQVLGKPEIHTYFHGGPAA
jgi:hypothetical protein